MCYVKKCNNFFGGHNKTYQLAFALIGNIGTKYMA